MTTPVPSRQDEPSAAIPPYAIKTWRYLRVAMIMLVAGLGVAVGHELVRTGCLKNSISAYYYTPARGLFVGALVGIAACLVCLQGSTTAENILLNLAGALAPVVAFVPTTDHGGCPSIESATENSGANIANNVHALLIVGGAALMFVALTARRERPPRAALVAAVATAVVWLAALGVFEFERTFFAEHAHGAAAVPMFLFITAVVAINAFKYKADTNGTLRNRYTAIAIGMGLAIAADLIGYAVNWSERTVVSEIALLGLFALFWTFQTHHLWKRGLWETPR
jgi:uncharacterized membrane protein